MTRRKRLDAYLSLISARGGEGSIQGQYRTEYLGVADEQKHSGLILFRVEGWRQYSRQFGARRASIAYLCGKDDNGRWAVRVPGTCTTVEAALAKITPTIVSKAQEKGKRVIRQGDLYLVQTRKDDFRALLGTRHVWNPETRTVEHTDPDNPHATLSVPFPARAVMQTVLRMGRLGSHRTRYGD